MSYDRPSYFETNLTDFLYSQCEEGSPELQDEEVVRNSLEAMKYIMNLVNSYCPKIYEEFEAALELERKNIKNLKTNQRIDDFFGHYLESSPKS